MARVTERWESRRDTWLFAGCMLLSALALLMPARWGMPVATGLRDHGARAVRLAPGTRRRGPHQPHPLPRRRRRA